MIVRPATLGDAMFVMKNLSEQSRSERDAMGVTDWQMLKMINGWMEDQGAAAGVVGSAPVVLFGIIKSDEVTTTWFLATQEYFDLGAPAVLHARRYLKSKRKEHGPLVTVSRSNHPAVDRWFELLGYFKIGEKDGAKVYQYG